MRKWTLVSFGTRAFLEECAHALGLLTKLLWMCRLIEPLMCHSVGHHLLHLLVHFSLIVVFLIVGKVTIITEMALSTHEIFDTGFLSSCGCGCR